MDSEELSVAATSSAHEEESAQICFNSSETSRPANNSEEPTRDSVDSNDFQLESDPAETTDDAQDNGNAVRDDDANEAHEASDGRSPPEGGRNEDEDWLAWVKQHPKNTNIKWSNYEAFVNRFSRDEGFDIIEVLAGHPDLMSKEISKETARRRQNNQTASLRRHPAENEYKFIHQVRIQSPAILHVLSRLTAQDDWNIDEPRTFLRPFETFYYSLPLLKQFLEVLERRSNVPQTPELDISGMAGSLPRRTTASAQADGSEDFLRKLSMPSDVDLEDIVFGIPDLQSAVEHMVLYIDFVENHIIPMWTEAAGTTKQKVRFSDLPMYFRPGDILYKPLNTSEDKDKAGKVAFNNASTGGLAVFQNYWKLCYGTIEAWDADPSNDTASGVKRWVFMLYSFHVDFDGDRYGPMSSKQPILRYEGEKDIRTLYAYPLRFETDVADIRSKLTKRAKDFLAFVQRKHLYYDGWTLFHSTFPSGVEKAWEAQVVEHIEGEIMVDFKEGYQSGAGFVKPALVSPEPEGRSSLTTDHVAVVAWWSDRTRSQMLGYMNDTQTVERFDILQGNHMLQKDRVLRVFQEKERVSEFDPDHMLLFPQRLIAYSFRARKFFVANIDSTNTISAPKNSFRDLKVDVEHKRILRSLVGSHFQKQDIRRQNKDAVLDQDFIRGKGSGLVILLHGVPGVGKTTTAEAVALTNRKPLFALTSGDLGSTPTDVEKALRETFRLATLWDCVLLLDEADLFLAKRDVGDLERNSLVSVFLRVLDYYDGVLFLTTNRVGTVDEAFRSRIHLTLYYPPLKRKQTMEIFRLNIRRVKEIENSRAELHRRQVENDSNYVPIEIDENSILDFAMKHWERTPRSRRWNGRQIRNAFQVAYSLVHFSRLTSTVPEHDEHDEDYDYDVSDDDEDYDYGSGEEENPNDLSARFRGKEVDMISAASPGQAKNKGKLDSYQFKIVARSIRRFDDYLEFTRGKDSDYARVMLLRRDDFVSSDEGWESKSPRAGGRFLGGHPSRSGLRRMQNRSPAPRQYVTPSSDRGGMARRDPVEERRERPKRNDKRTPKLDDLDEEEIPLSRRRRGVPASGATRNRWQRGYNYEEEEDDEEEEDFGDHGRYRK